VDKPDILKSVKIGDTIKATVYDGDFTAIQRSSGAAGAEGQEKIIAKPGKREHSKAA